MFGGVFVVAWCVLSVLVLLVYAVCYVCLCVLCGASVFFVCVGLSVGFVLVCCVLVYVLSV